MDGEKVIAGYPALSVQRSMTLALCRQNKKPSQVGQKPGEGRCKGIAPHLKSVFSRRPRRSRRGCRLHQFSDFLPRRQSRIDSRHAPVAFLHQCQCRLDFGETQSTTSCNTRSRRQNSGVRGFAHRLPQVRQASRGRGGEGAGRVGDLTVEVGELRGVVGQRGDCEAIRRTNFMGRFVPATGMAAVAGPGLEGLETVLHQHLGRTALAMPVANGSAKSANRLSVLGYPPPPCGRRRPRRPKSPCQKSESRWMKRLSAAQSPARFFQIRNPANNASAA